MPDGSVGAAGMAGGAVGQVQNVFGGSVMAVGAGLQGVGGGFEFSPEELAAVIQGWEDLLVEFKQDQDHIREMQEMVIPPAEDSSSVGFTDAVRAGLADLYESNDSMVKYAEEYLEKLRAAKESNEATEAGHSDAVASFLDSMES